MADSQIRTIVRGLERLTERAIVKITFDLVANLVESTPVDTGWARANWVPNVGIPHVEDLEGVEASPQNAAAAAGGRDSALASVAAQYRLRMGAVFVANNVPYIQDLNDGSSTQQPAGFVQRAVAKAVTQDILGLAR